MAWTTPMTFVANTVLTAEMLNTFLSGNLLETETAKATTAGSWFIGDGTNSIVERIPQFANVSATEDTASSTYTNLTTVGPAVTAYTGSRAIVFFSANISNHTDNGQSYMAYEISGAQTQAASDNKSLQVDGVLADANNRRCMISLEEDLNPGWNTFTAKYRVPATAASFSDRFIGVWPL